jgi:hypothetical protein
LDCRPPTTTVALALWRLTDERYPIDGALTEDILVYATPRNLRIVEAAAQRALGVARDHDGALARALDLYRAMAARPLQARVDAEVGLLTGDGDRVSSAMSALEAIGDQAQAMRIGVRARERGLEVD